MDFDTKAFNIILVIFQMNVIFQQTLFLNIVMHVFKMKNFIQMFFLKSHEWNFSYGWNGTINSYLLYD
jgi:hypothetical protein